ncbi:putative ABC transporter, permease protein [Candidatus Rhodobacter oscarellae]|uniref:Putative ABC transporter, permease protein n=1 Tax=Candidatus Rhodobacter oscarellae TaxID=1675527 RepID=A0A0J9E5V6_9RHOB|nr:FtsX-like permease family protein [Candidatus Rhodobacter lobularis]KMW58125.1 putative ABC transporter, permease protein [Candidatus Rhodobacter lobularis]
MSFANAKRIARRELRGGLRGFRVFLACLALGVAAIAAVGSVRMSIQLGLEREGAVILGGDAEIELTYRFAEPQERAWMEGVSDRVSEIVDFRSMAVVTRGEETERGLTQVKGVDGAYPLYGAPVLEPELELAAALAGRDTYPGAVMDPVLIARLGLAVGETFRLGAQDFVLMAALEREPDSAGGGFGLGPRTIVALDALQGSGLLAPGTLFESAYRLALPEGADLGAMAARAEAELDGAGLRWRDARNGAPGVAQFVDRLGAFLVLVGLAGLAVGGVGVSAAVRAYLDQKTQVIATLKTLGAETRTIFLAYGLQIGALTLAGIAIGLVLGAVAPLALAPIIQERLPVPAVFALHPRALAEAALYGALAAAVFTLWPLARTENVRAAALYRDGAGGRVPLPRWPYLLVTAALVGALVLAAAYLSGLARLTIWSAAGMAVAFIALIGIAALTRAAARRLARTRLARGRSALRMALGSVGGPGSEAGAVVLSLGLGLTVLATVGQIDANFRSAIARDLPDVAPSFFVVDIQNAQIDAFLERVEADPEVTRVQTAPMLRGVITRINDRPAAEVAGDHWVIQGDRGITYSAAPPEGAVVTAGRWWDADYDGPPQVSFADEEAAEMGLALGDSLTINVLGRDITAEVTSFRDVDFSNAGIGFILSMNPGALAGAPHTHIATLYGEEAADARLLRELGNAYPNITLIRVRDAIARVTEVLQGIAAATTYGALATLLTGFVVLIGAAAAGERARTYEAAILKTLGASRATVLANFALRSAIFGLAAGLVAIAAGAAAGWGVMTFVMETDYAFEPGSALAIVTGGALTSLVAGLAFAWRPLAARPARVLRASE